MQCLVNVFYMLNVDRSRTQPNKTFKCSTQELTQGHLLVTIIFTQRFQIAFQHKKGGWQIHNDNQQIKLNATMIKNVLTSLIQTKFHLS